jgi:hypothetical protein
MMDINKRIIDLSVSEVIEILELFTGKGKQQSKALTDAVKDSNKHFVYGLAGLAGLFGCSKTTASRIKQGGKIDGAITQIGNIIVIDAGKALELAGRKLNVIKNNNNQKNKNGNKFNTSLVARRNR